jgi:5-formyltetrahydrofolate cyclo-ligase
VNKRQLRAHFRALRRQHALCLQQGLDQLGEPDLKALLAQRPGLQREAGTVGAVGFCWPLADEPDLRPWLQGLQQPLALPAVAGGRLLYRPWQPGQLLQPDDCGIPAPVAAGLPLQPGQLALLLVPALAVDRRGVRLGYGGGWYDRLRADPAWRQVPALVVLPAACVCDRLPDDPWDVRFDGWLDQQGCHWIAPGPDRI